MTAGQDKMSAHNIQNWDGLQFGESVQIILKKNPVTKC